jgi:Flp pilus assembly protein TadD
MTNDNTHLDFIIQRANGLLAQGLINDAAEAFESILYTYPEDLQAMNGIARIALLLDQPKDAHNFALRARKYYPDDPDARLIELLAIEQLEDTIHAVESMLELCQDHPNHTQIALETARMLDQIGRSELARHYADRAAILQPDSVSAHFLRGSIYRKIGGIREAISSFDAAIKFAPQEISLYLEQISLLTEIGEFDAALQMLDEAHRCCGLNAFHIAGRQSGLFALKGDWERTVKACEKVAKYLPQHPQAWCNLSLAQMTIGQIEEAEASLLKAASIDPNNWQPPYILANLYAACDLTDKAEQQYRLAIQLNEQAWEPLNNLALLLLAQITTNAHREALQILQQAQTIMPSEPSIQLNLALAYLKNQQTVEARDILQALLNTSDLPVDIAEQARQLLHQ